MPHLQSQALERVEYDPAGRPLFVRFVGGGGYASLDVPEAVVRALTGAQSAGHVSQAAGRDRYAYRRLDPVSPSTEPDRADLARAGEARSAG